MTKQCEIDDTFMAGRKVVFFSKTSAIPKTFPHVLGGILFVRLRNSRNVWAVTIYFRLVASSQC